MLVVSCSFTKGVHINFCPLSLSIFLFVWGTFIGHSAKCAPFLRESRRRVYSAVLFFPPLTFSFSSTLFNKFV